MDHGLSPDASVYITNDLFQLPYIKSTYMKKYLLVIACGCSISCAAQNVGIVILVPTERLHVVQTADFNKNTIYGFANQTSSSLIFLI